MKRSATFKALAAALVVPAMTLAGTVHADLLPGPTPNPHAQENYHDSHPIPPPSTEPMLHDPAAPAHGTEHPASHGEGAHEGHHGPAPINWADFSNKEQPPYAAAFLNFAILLGLGYSLGKKPIAEALKARRAAVAKDIEEAARMKAAAEERAKKYQASLENLDADLATTKAALIESGKADKERIVKEAEEKALRMRRDADFRVEQEQKQLRLDLTRETVETAVREAEVVLASKVTAEDHTRLANEFLAELSAKPVLVGGAA